MPYQLGPKMVTKAEFLEYLATERRQYERTCTAGSEVLQQLGVSAGVAREFADSVLAILAQRCDREMAEIEAEGPESECPVDMKEFLRLGDQIQVFESQLEQLRINEVSADVNVKPGIAAMRLGFEQQLNGMRERQSWMQEQLEKFNKIEVPE